MSTPALAWYFEGSRSTQPTRKLRIVRPAIYEEALLTIAPWNIGIIAMASTR